MKNTMLVIMLALIVVTTSLAFAQGAPQDQAGRAKEQIQTKQHVMRAKSAFQQKQEVLLDEGQTAKATHMMKKMALGMNTQSTMYPKCEILCRMGQQTCPEMQDGGNRGKQGFTGKQMMENCPMRDKMQQHAQPRGK